MDRTLRQTLGKIPWGILLASLPALVLLAALASYYRDMASDDAYISFRYAARLAAGDGLEWNPGYRVEGYSNFLWVLIIGVLGALGAPIPEAARALAWLAAAVAMVAVVAASRLGADRGARVSWSLAALAPLPLAVSFPYVWWVSMRLETAAYGTLLLLTLLLFAREEADPPDADRRRWGSAIPLLGLIMIRPEGPAFVAVPALYLLLKLRSVEDLRRQLRRRWVWVAIWAGGALLYHLWRVSYFGELLPNTYHAKEMGDNQLSEGWVYLRRLATERPMHVVLACAPLLLGALAVRAGQLLMGALALMTGIIVLEGGDWMREWRFFQPGVPLAAAALAVGLQRVARGGRAAALGAAAGVLLLLGAVHNLMGTPWSEWKAAFRGEKRDMLINMEGELPRVSEEVARWLRENGRPSDLIAVNHAGALPYYSGMPVIDMAGLNDRHIARQAGHGLVHTKWDSDYVLSLKPTFVVLNTRVYPSDFEYVPGYWQGETDLAQHPDFRRQYEAVRKVWRWRDLGLNVRGAPALASEKYIMVFRRVKASHRKVGACLDFESGDFSGWTPTGEAFGGGPVKRRPPPGVREDFIGKWIADSYQGLDARTGTLRSDPFEVVGDRFELVVGGGGGPGRAGVRLLLDGASVREVSGRNDHQLRHVRWDVTDLKGKSVQVELFDEGSAEWDHVLADNICQYVKVK